MGLFAVERSKPRSLFKIRHKVHETIKMCKIRILEVFGVNQIFEESLQIHIA